MSTIAAVSHSHAFGLKGDVTSPLHYIDETTLLYPSGANVLHYNIEQKTQRFIPQSERGEGITCMTLSSNKKFLAVGERGERASIVIYDIGTMRRRKVLNLPETVEDGKEFVCIHFSTDAKYLVGLTGAPDATLYYYSWEKGKVMATLRATNASQAQMYHVSFNPSDNSQLCVTGNGAFKLVRYTEGILKQFGFQKIEIKNYLCHAWVSDDRVVAGTDDGRLMIFEAGELRHEINVAEERRASASIDCILAYSKGFICAGSGGLITLYEKADADREYFKKTKELSLHDDLACVKCIALSPSEDNLVCTLATNQMYTITLSSAEMIKGDEAALELLAQPFHHGMITGMDVCVRKPLIVTCSTDRSVRVWNYVDSAIDLVKYFPEEAFSVALHPSGLIILVGFSDKLRLMNLLIDDIRPYREFTVRGCRECRFSNGGQYFAAVHGNTIQVYSTWTFENIGNLKGHNGKVRSIFFNADDTKLISAGMDGAIYDWALKDLKREGENVLKSCSYTCAVCSPDGKTIYAVGSDKMIKEIVDSQVVREIETTIVETQLALSHSGRMMFTGTSLGTIRAIKFPFGAAMDTIPGVAGATGQGNDYQEHQAHSAPVTRLRISYDDQYLFSASEDGCLYIFKVSDKEGRGLKRERELQFAEEILVTKSDLEEKNTLMAELKTRVEELKLENEYQLRLKDMNFNEKVKELTEKFTQEIEALKITRSVLKSDKEKEEMRHEEEMAEIRDRHQRELQEIEAQNNQKLMAEYEKYQELQGKVSEMQQQWERQLQDMQVAHKREILSLTTQYEGKLKDRQSEIEQLQEEMRQQFHEFEETAKEIEEDADTEILEVKAKYEKRLKEEKDAGLRLKGENGIMKKKFNTLQKEIEDHKTEIQKLFHEEKKLHSVIKSLEKDISGLKKEIQERDETIQDKEKRIYDLKKKNQELEKFKFVLDYKIKELKRQIEPREKDILGMTHQIKEMDTELEKYHKQNANLDLVIEDLKLKLKAGEREIGLARQQGKELHALIKRFRIDLFDCVQFIQEPNDLKDAVRRLYHKYCKENDATQQAVDTDVAAEYQRQREYLERTVASLRRKLGKDTSVHRADNVRILQENVSLIAEINQLRRELKSFKQRERAEASHGQGNSSNNAAARPTSAHGPVKLPPLTSDLTEQEKTPRDVLFHETEDATALGDAVHSSLQNVAASIRASTSVAPNPSIPVLTEGD